MLNTPSQPGQRMSAAYPVIGARVRQAGQTAYRACQPTGTGLASASRGRGTTVQWRGRLLSVST